LLTHWLSAINILYPEIRLKSSIFWLSYQSHSSSADCARELFKPSKDLASLLVCNEKNFLVLGVGFYMSGIKSEVFFRPFWLMLPGLEHNH